MSLEKSVPLGGGGRCPRSRQTDTRFLASISSRLAADAVMWKVCGFGYWKREFLCHALISSLAISTVQDCSVAGSIHACRYPSKFL
jgi:hypothetical protein